MNEQNMNEQDMNGEDTVDMEFTLPDDLIEQIDELVALGLYPDRGAVVVAALTAMQERESRESVESGDF